MQTHCVTGCQIPSTHCSRAVSGLRETVKSLFCVGCTAISPTDTKRILYYRASTSLWTAATVLAALSILGQGNYIAYISFEHFPKSPWLEHRIPKPAGLCLRPKSISNTLKHLAGLVTSKTDTSAPACSARCTKQWLNKWCWPLFKPICIQPLCRRVASNSKVHLQQRPRDPGFR